MTGARGAVLLSEVAGWCSLIFGHFAETPLSWIDCMSFREYFSPSCVVKTVKGGNWRAERRRIWSTSAQLLPRVVTDSTYTTGT
jgi:hypothetical protein